MISTNYLQLESGRVIPYKISEGKKDVTLSSGIYSLTLHPLDGMVRIIAFDPFIPKDNLINFKDSVVQRIVDKVTTFFSKETVDAYKELKISHKMGVLLYGGHGSGKTSVGMLAMQEMAKSHNAVCIDATKADFWMIKAALDTIRAHQDNPIILFIDEFDDRINEEESRWLPFLDGNDSVNGLAFLGCTNYITKIPDRIKDRKSRIKYKYEINKLPMAVYKEYIKDRISNISEAHLAEFAFKSEEAGLTIDQLKNALIDYKIDALSIDEAIKIASSVKPTEEE